MTERELSDRIAGLYKSAGWEHDRMSDDITLMKMTVKQRDDLAAMIVYFANHGDEGQQEVGYILANVGHDLAGFKAGFLDMPDGLGFSPRSWGYAVRTP